MKHFLSTILFSSLLILAVHSKTAEEWRSRSVYQIITDRFAKTDGSATPCGDLGNYCGGTFKGIQNNLDYIQGMGFDAIWISPVVANTPNGYHGYWTSNLYEVNENFGTAEELKELIQLCHDKDIWVMVDIVANHMGYVDNWNYTSIVPFDKPEHYNNYFDCAHVDPRDQGAMERCWLSGLPDLNQDHPFVKQTILEWVKDFVQTYDFDALRIDTVPYVTKDFWTEFSKAAGVYTIGEILSYDLPYIASYQGPLDSVLNYALYSTLRYTFQSGGSMTTFQNYYDGAYATWKDITVIGNFVNNHDNPRFLSASSSHETFKASLAFTMCSIGIPIVYYGDEQAYGGGQDPMNREALWTNMNAESDIYKYIKTINTFRKDTQFFSLDQTQRYADNNFYAFTRGQYFFAFTNCIDYQARSISFHPYAEGTTLCNLFHKGDCVQVKNGQFPVVLTNGEVKIFVPTQTSEEGQTVEGQKTWNDIKIAFASKTKFESKTFDSWRISN